MKSSQTELFKIQFYKHYLILAKELYDLSKPNKKTPHLGDLRKRKLYGSIIFLALALESFINEIGIEYLNIEFNEIERMPTVKQNFRQ